MTDRYIVNGHKRNVAMFCKCIGPYVVVRDIDTRALHYGPGRCYMALLGAITCNERRKLK